MHEWVIHLVDVKSAFLNSPIGDEELYVKQPPGFAVSGKEDWVWRLKRGLVQAEAVWHTLVSKAGFSPHQFWYDCIRL